jgi:UDP-N-acetylglucosamine--N-acetylmuramyl-(pentapeptide) pyrophosphoryl-undecaprenol N-acetylglucosamine transferase
LGDKKIVLTGGGTAGHVTPNMALLPGLKKKGYRIHYIGSLNGIERQLANKEGLHYHSIQTGKLRRYLDLKNLTDVFRVAGGFFQALTILGKIKPDVVFSKGGFVSCPVVWAAWLRQIPVVIHESDLTPGLTNRLSIPFASKACYTFPESANHIPVEKGVLTGLPVRDTLLKGDRLEGLRMCGFTGTKPVLLVFGGSQGSETINSVVREALYELVKIFDICHICGKGNIKAELSGKFGYKQFEYVNEDLAHLFAMADLFVSRAGATSLFEILALKKPALLIPLSRKVSRGDQILNARSFEKSGYSVVMEEEELDSPSLISKVTAIYNNRDTYINAMKKSDIPASNDIILNILEEVQK